MENTAYCCNHDQQLRKFIASIIRTRCRLVHSVKRYNPARYRWSSECFRDFQKKMCAMFTPKNFLIPHRDSTAFFEFKPRFVHRNCNFLPTPSLKVSTGCRHKANRILSAIELKTLHAVSANRRKKSLPQHAFRD